MCAIMTLGMAAQSVQEHLKFAGIPINGTITQFQSKLITRGTINIKVDEDEESIINAFNSILSLDTKYNFMFTMTKIQKFYIE